MRDATPKTIYLKNYTPPEYLIDSVELRFLLEEESTRVISRLAMRKNLDSPNNEAELELVGESLQLHEVSVDGRKLTPSHYLLKDDALTIPAAPKTKPFVLEVENSINPKANTALEGLYLSNGMFCTQCEAEGFRKITYFLDRPDVMARFKTTLIADKSRYPVLLSNGNLIATGELKNNRHWVTWEDPFKKPCYLFALIAGQLEYIRDTHTTGSGRDIDLRLYVEKHDLDKCAHAMQSLKHAMQWDERVYGREYDLDLYMIVAVGHFNMGAMENKGLNVFNTKFVLARPDTATDADYEQIEAVIGHEYFHNWTGNRITCRDWFQLSLKEGLTVFRDQEFTADRTSRAVKRINDISALRTRQFAEDAGPLAHPVRPDSYIEINNFYTVTVYEKGAEVVRMLHTLLGADGFRKGTDLYFERYDGQAVTTDDFVSVMENANGADFSQFRLWYSQAGTPVLQITENFAQGSGTLTLTIRQSCPPTPGQPRKLPFDIPVRIGLLAEDGSKLPIQLEGETGTSLEKILRVKQAKHQFTIINLPHRPIISMLRGFSAPVKVDMARSQSDLVFLLRHDTDTFNRWEAGQQLITGIILERVGQYQKGEALPVLDKEVIETYRKLIGIPLADKSYLSQLIALPSDIYLGVLMDVVDTDAIHAARQFVKRQLAQSLYQELIDIYTDNHADEPGCLDAQTIGRRKLKNACLGYLSVLEDDDVYTLMDRQFSGSSTMTDQIAALNAIVNSSYPRAGEALQRFYDQWQTEALVVDKWFTLQATSQKPNTIGVVNELLGHAAFDLKNPNRARSLIGAFSQANPLHFHAADGSGYEFLANQIIELDAFNPQIAARMLGAFSAWRRFDEHHQELMRKQLERIIATQALSKDTYEVASKCIA